MNLIPSTIRERFHRLYTRAERSDHQLLYLFLEITRRCNLACKHCGSDCSSQNDTPSLSTDSWVRLIHHISEKFTPTPTIVLTGGEPILCPDFDVIVETLNKTGLRWGMVSNGYSLEENTLGTLLKNDLYSITISLDGLKDNHNWLRGKADAYARTIHALRILAQARIPMKDVVTCVNPRNVENLDEIARTLIDVGITSWRLFRIFPAGRARDNEQLLLSHRQTRNLLDWIGQNRVEYQRRGLHVGYGCEGWLPFSIDTKVRDQPFFCRAGINIGSILCDGTITGCTNNSERFFEGNVLKDSFTYVWNNGFSQNRNRAWVQSTNCGKCRQKEKCGGSSIHLWRENRIEPEFCYLECYE